MALERYLAFACALHERLGMGSAFNKLSDDLLKEVLQRPELKHDSITYINAECELKRKC